MSFSPAGLTPLIQVFDMTRSLAFYRDLLGFEVVSASPEVQTREGRFSHWMWLRLGPINLMLNTQYDSNERPEERDRARTAGHNDVSFYIGCRDVDEVYRTLKARRVEADPPNMASYGLKVFSVVDPDGYGLTFQQTPRE